MQFDNDWTLCSRSACGGLLLWPTRCLRCREAGCSLHWSRLLHTASHSSGAAADFLQQMSLSCSLEIAKDLI